MRLPLILILVFAAGIQVNAQVQIDKQINMNGAADNDRRITNLADPSAGTDAVSVSNVITGRLAYALSTGSGGNYVVTLPVTPGGYTAGMVVNFTANHANTGAATLQVNSLTPAKAIVKAGANPLLSGDIVLGQIVSVIYDGTSFQLTNSGTRPAGTAAGDLSGSYPNPQIAANAITDADINSAAAISRSKVADGNANEVVINNGSGTLSSEAQLALSRGGTNNNTYTSGKFIAYDGSKLASTAYDQNSFASSTSLNGTTNYMAKFTAGNAVGNSVMYDNGSSVGIGTTTPAANIEIATAGASFRVRNTTATGYGTMRIYNEQNNAFRALEIDYSGSSYPTSLLSGGVTGEGASIATTGNYPMMIGTSNTSRITILGSGNIGMSTATPGSKLDIYESGSTPQNSVLKLEAFADATNEGPFIDFHERWTGAYPNWITGRIGSVYETNSAGNNNGALVFYTNTNNDANQGTAGTTEKMRIQGNGYVGIGTTAPTSALQIHQTTGVRISDPVNGYAANLNFGIAGNGWNSGIRVYDNANAEMRIWHTSSAGQIILANAYNGDGSTSMPTDGMFIVGDAGVNRVGIGYNATNMRGNGGKLLVNGNVGVGTAAPRGILDVDAAGSNNIYFSTYPDYNFIITGGDVMRVSRDNGTPANMYLQYSHNAHTILNGGTSSGNVGIHTSPSYPLHVVGDIWQGTIMADASTAGNYSSFGIAAAGTRKWSFYNHPGGGGGDALYFANAAGQDRLGILQNGNVGVNTTSPNYKFQVNGALNAGYVLLGDNGGNSNNTIEYVNGPGSTTYIGGYINYYSANNLGLCNGGGNVNIGPVSPSFQLQLSSNSAAKPGSNAWTIASDARLKTNIHDYKDGLASLQKIHPVWFTYTGEADMPKETYVGILAQELKEVAPYMVGTWTHKDKDGKATGDYLSVDNSAMTYMLVNSVKEQQQIIEKQQGQINQLLEKVKQLELRR